MSTTTEILATIRAGLFYRLATTINGTSFHRDGPNHVTRRVDGELVVAYHNLHDLTAGTPVTLDLTALADHAGDIIEFDEILAVFVKNESEEEADYILVGPQGADDPWSEPWDSEAAAASLVYPGGCWTLESALNPIPVIDLAKNFRLLHDGAYGSSSTIRAGVCIVGRTPPDDEYGYGY